MFWTNDEPKKVTTQREFDLEIRRLIEVRNKKRSGRPSREMFDKIARFLVEQEEFLVDYLIRNENNDYWDMLNFYHNSSSCRAESCSGKIRITNMVLMSPNAFFYKSRSEMGTLKWYKEKHKWPLNLPVSL